MNDPVAVVEVERRVIVEQVHLGLPVGVHGAHVLPVAVEAVSVDAGPGVDHVRHDVLAEVVPLVEPRFKGPGAEDVDAETGQVRLRLPRLLLPLGDGIALVEAEHPEAMSRLDGHGLDRDGHVCPLAPVLLDEGPVVHLVDVIAAEHEDDVRA